MQGSKRRSWIAVRWLKIAAGLALVLSTVLGSVLEADPSYAKDRGRKGNTHAAMRDRDARIIDGAPVAQGTYPFAVFVQFQREGSETVERCSGSLIAADWVLTAAHCVPATGQYRALASIGAVAVNDYGNGVRRGVSGTWMHPRYSLWPSAWGAVYDVALLRLAEPVPIIGAGSYPAIGIPPASSEPLAARTPLVAAGWGGVEPGGEPSSILHAADMPAIDDAACAGLWDLPMSDMTSLLCAGTESSGAICMGDGGGPLFAPGGSVQYGVASFGTCIPGQSVFADVTEPEIHRFITELVRTTDDTPSSVSITSPRPGATVPSGFQIEATVSDGRSGVSTVEFWACADQCTLLGKDLTAPYQWPSAALQAGRSHDLFAVAYDNAGNRGESVRVPITTEEGGESGGKPRLACCHLEESPEVEGVFLAPGTSNLYYRPGVGAADVTLLVEASVKGGSIASVEFPPILGAAGGPGSPVDGSPFLWQFRYLVPESGTSGASLSHESILATTSGNRSRGTVISVIPDDLAPNVRIARPKENSSLSGSVAVKVEASDPNPRGSTSSGVAIVEFWVCTPQCALLGKDDEAPFQYTGYVLQPGQTGQLVAWAYDRVGNRGESTRVTVCGGTCDDPGPGPSPTPPPGDINPDDWRTAEHVTGSDLPFSQLLDTDGLSSGADDPSCVDETTTRTPYTHSAWYHLTVERDTMIHVDTAASAPDANPDEELNTVVLVGFLPRGADAVSTIMCFDDRPEEGGISLAAELFFTAHRGFDYYVMAGTVASPPQDGYLLVEISEFDPSGG